MKLASIIKLMRLHQYIKNLFIFLPLFFAMKITDIGLFSNAFIAFIAFSLTASAIYTLNDYHDIEEDREGMDLPEKLTAQPQEVAEDIYKAQQKGKNVLYTKWIWRWVMLIIKIIPEWKFKGMSI